MNRMPTLYIPHGGGPCFFMEWTIGPPDTWHHMGSWLRQTASSLPARPKSILIISAHWEEQQVSITNAPKPALLYDYYGFPTSTYELKYDAPSDSKLAERVHALLSEAGFDPKYERERGFDHGVFIPLKLVYPQADIPIVQVSLLKGLDPARHIELGEAMAPLRTKEVLIVGSGMSYHNLRNFGGENGKHDSLLFDQWLESSVSEPSADDRNRLLIDWKRAPSAREAHPREEHLIPLMVTSGAAEKDQGKRIYTGNVNGIAISAFQFGS